jgi:hypothetical protein
MMPGIAVTAADCAGLQPGASPQPGCGVCQTTGLELEGVEPEEMAGRSRRQRQLAQHLASRRCDAQDRLGTAALMDFLADGVPMLGDAEHADGLCGGSFLGRS